MSDDELWDLTDAAGTPTGRTHRRGDPDWPEGEVFHVVASTCVVREDGRVLVSQRAAVKDHPLRWEFPAGSALAGETSVEAARRELEEEVGLVAAPARFVLVGRVREARALFDLYLLAWTGDAPLRLDPEEVAASRWVAYDEVERLCRDGLMAAPWVARLEVLGAPLRAALDAAGGA